MYTLTHNTSLFEDTQKITSYSYYCPWSFRGTMPKMSPRVTNKTDEGSVR